MAKTICQAKKNGTVKSHEKPSIEWYRDKKHAQYYCCGYTDKSTGELIDACKTCIDHISRAQKDINDWVNNNPGKNTHKKQAVNTDILEQVKTLELFARKSSALGRQVDAKIFNDAASTIKQLMSGLKENQDNWIPCSEKMPKIGEPVLVSDKQGNVCIRAVTSEIKGIKHWSQNKYDIIAWQPKPEPYQKPDR